MSQLRLGLDEASILINKTASSLAGDPILVLYQIEECFGCPLDRLKRLEGNDQAVVLGTKHAIDLELRRIRQHQLHHQPHLHEESSSLVCNLAKLSLSSQARYRLDIQEIAKTNRSVDGATEFDCSLHTIDEGECSYCPFALLLLVMLLVTAIEKVYTRFVCRSRPGASGAGSLPQPPILSSSTMVGCLKHQQPDEADNSPSGAADGLQQAVTAENPLTRAEESNQMVMVLDPNPDGLASNQERPQDADGDSIDSVPGQRVARSASLANNSNGNGNGAPINRAPRIESLDAFRGLTIAGMIVVNYGGAGYRLLEHQPWDGLTLADLVFPFFIFSMGASIALSTKAQMKRGKSLGEILVKILRRAIVLMLLGLCLNSKWLNIQTQGLDELRLTGVLQRFSVSYLVVATMYSVKLSVIKWIKAQSLYRVPFISRLVGFLFEHLTALNYLAVYLYVSFFFQYSDLCPVGYLGPGGMTENGIYANCTGGAAAWLDRTVLGPKHLYHDREVMQVYKTKQSHDPEGLLGNTTSILLTLIGLQCGKILSKSKRNNMHKSRVQSFLKWLLVLALITVSAVFIPINKRLWSLPFVSVSAICAFALMTLLYILLDVYECQRTFLLRLLISAGKNPIFLYVGHSLLSGMLPWHFYVDESSHLQLLLRVTWSTLCWLLIAHYMASKRLFIRV